MPSETRAGRSVGAGLASAVATSARRASAPASRSVVSRADLLEVVEHDHRRRQVEHRVGQAKRVCVGHRDALPAGNGLVGQVADAGREREGRVADRRRAMREDAAQRFERVGGRELFDRATAEQDRPIAAHLERPSVDADQRVAAVAGSLLGRLQQEGAAGAEPQGCGDGGQRVGRQLEAVDRRKGRNCGGHRFGIHENDNASILEGRRRLPRCHPDSNRCRSALRTHGRIRRCAGPGNGGLPSPPTLRGREYPAGNSAPDTRSERGSRVHSPWSYHAGLHDPGSLWWPCEGYSSRSTPSEVGAAS